MAAVKFNRKTIGRNKQVLRYPLKMFTAGTDYLQIDMLDYVPVAKATGQEAIMETRDIPAEPLTLIAPAKADVAISEVAKAVKPTFFKLFILITPYV